MVCRGDKNAHGRPNLTLNLGLDIWFNGRVNNRLALRHYGIGGDFVGQSKSI